MGTVVCQGLQSCLESQIAESRTLRLRLSAPKPTSESAPFMPKRSVSSSLSEKSLELCTENLGSETGAEQQLSDDPHDSNYNCLFSSAPSSEGIGYSDEEEKPSESCRRPTAAAAKSRTRRRSGNGNGFPPPLTTMRGPELIQVRPHREGGRLVMKAVKSQSPPPCFEAERIDSRLRLHVVVGRSDAAFDSAIVTECDDININNNNDDDDDNTNNVEEDEILEEEGMERRNTSCKEEEEEGRHRHHGENAKVSSNKVGLVVGLNWEQFRVATALQV